MIIQQGNAMTQVFIGDCQDSMKTMGDRSINTCVTSPPYFGLRSYLPGTVVLRKYVPDDILAELVSLGIKPIDLTKA